MECHFNFKIAVYLLLDFSPDLRCALSLFVALPVSCPNDNQPGRRGRGWVEEVRDAGPAPPGPGGGGRGVLDRVEGYREHSSPAGERRRGSVGTKQLRWADGVK